MQIPKATFLINEKLEANYICYLAKSVITGFYANSGYRLLPYLEKENYQTCYFPDLSYSENFWRKLKTIKKLDYGQDAPQELVNEILSKLTNARLKIGTKKINKIKSDWKEKERNFWHVVGSFLDTNDFVAQIKEIEILVTSFGTAGSFYLTKTKNGYKISLTQRADMPADMIGKTLLLAFDKIVNSKEGTKGDQVWYNRQNNIEYLLENSVFKKILPCISKSNLSNHTNSEELFKDSSFYLDRLGFPEKSVLEDINGQILINNQNATKVFTKNEQRLLQKLIGNKNRVISFDEAAEIVWQEKNEDKFSLFSLAKLIENIRHKIKNYGVYKEVIHTVRGVGYIYS